MYITHLTPGSGPFAQDPLFGHRGLMRVELETFAFVPNEDDAADADELDDSDAPHAPYDPYAEEPFAVPAVPEAWMDPLGRAPWIMFTPLEWTVPCRGRFHLYFELDPTAPGGAIRIARLDYLDGHSRKGGGGGGPVNPQHDFDQSTLG